MSCVGPLGKVGLGADVAYVPHFDGGAYCVTVPRNKTRFGPVFSLLGPVW